MREKGQIPHAEPERPRRHAFAATLIALLTSAAMPPAVAWAGDTPPAEEATPAPRQRSSHFVSTSAFMLFNLLPDPPSFFQLNYGFRPTDVDTIIVEAMTWTYGAPLGIPLFGGDYGDSVHDYPGRVRSAGVGLAYQRYLWRGIYATLHVTPFWQTYYDEGGEFIQSGFQLFMVGRVGYHFDLWNDRIFIEPSIAATTWPINTNLPASFEEQEAGWPGYFLFEPGLNVGVNF